MVTEQVSKMYGNLVSSFPFKTFYKYVKNSFQLNHQMAKGHPLLICSALILDPLIKGIISEIIIINF